MPVSYHLGGRAVLRLACLRTLHDWKDAQEIFFMSVLATVAVVCLLPSSALQASPLVAQAPAVGSLRVTTNPAVPARVTVDGVARSDWGIEPISMPAGAHEVCFSDVPGFVAPPCATVTVGAGATTSQVGSFTRLGLLKVEVQPPGLRSTVFVDGAPRDDFGSFAYSEAGNHRVCWGDVVGYQAPPCTDVAVTAGAQATVRGTFTTSASPSPGPAPALGTTGFLRVTTTPAVTSRIVVGGIPRGDFGIGPVRFPVGQHQVCFEDVPGFSTPPCQNVTVAQGAVSTVNGTFSRLGLLKVDVTPAGLPVDVVVDGAPRNRFGLFTSIEPGTYQVCGTAVSGYATPACVSAVVASGQQATLALTYTSAGAPGTFLETFDGTPGAPTPFSSDRWDVRRNITDYKLWGVGQPMEAQHGADCSAPPGTHQIQNWMVEGVFICRDHLMTSAYAESYGATYLTPAVTADLRTEAVVAWDVSTLNMSGRDWVDVWLTPADDFLVVPIGGRGPAYNGVPRNAIHVEKDGPRWVINVIRDFTAVATADFYESAPPSATVRTSFELRVTPTGLRFGTPADGRSVSLTAQVPFTRALVQWGHHSYNPTKDNSGVPATWHWDNFKISPALPMPMTKPTTERVIANVGDVRTVAFAGGAPTGARLAFNAVCKVELDFGTGFKLAAETPGSTPRGPETSHSYFVPVPAGASSVKVRFGADGWYAGFPCLFEDPVMLKP